MNANTKAIFTVPADSTTKKGKLTITLDTERDYFSITTGSGCAHDQILKAIPEGHPLHEEVKLWIDLHLSNLTTGLPMHGVANAHYFLTDKKDISAFISHLRLDSEEGQRQAEALAGRIAVRGVQEALEKTDLRFRPLLRAIDERLTSCIAAVSMASTTYPECQALGKQACKELGNSGAIKPQARGAFYEKEQQALINDQDLDGVDLLTYARGRCLKPLLGALAAEAARVKHNVPSQHSSTVDALIANIGKVAELAASPDFSDGFSGPWSSRGADALGTLMKLLRKYKGTLSAVHTSFLGCNESLIYAYELAERKRGSRRMVEEFVAEQMPRYEAEAEKAVEFFNKLKAGGFDELLTKLNTRESDEEEEQAVRINLMSYEVVNILRYSYLPIIDLGGEEWYVAKDADHAAEATEKYWWDMVDNDPKEFACLVGEETLVQWAMGKSAGPGNTKVNSLDEWIKLFGTCPQEQWASYDGLQVEGFVSPALYEALFDEEAPEEGEYASVLLYRNN